MRRGYILLLGIGGTLLGSYLTAYKLHLTNSLWCGTGGCEQVQSSPWAYFLNQPVAFWGALTYLVITVLAALSIYGRGSALTLAPWGIMLLAGWGVLFSAYLTYAELFWIHAICYWCVVSALLITSIFILALLEVRASRLVAVGDRQSTDAPRAHNRPADRSIA
ncbi:MAG: vitamin K epoxide reductase family protein [Deinococcus sp.]|nr:vitamin K epoxide reductase family protein [Deinococcus sp.]